MILVTLGTQDKSFKRLLKAVEKEIKDGNIKEKVVVQAGYTKYKSKYMEIFDLVSPKELDNLMNKARIIITHGGVGSILGALKYDKPVIAAPRLVKYQEHTNDHQIQIVEEFSKEGYLLYLDNFKKLSMLINECKTFKPKKYKSNNSKFLKLLDNYIENTEKKFWNKYAKIIILIIVIALILVFFF